MIDATSTTGFSEALLRKAISSYAGELAWKRVDVFEAIEEIAANNKAVLGGDVWAVLNSKAAMTNSSTVDPSNIFNAIIPCRNGESMIFTWDVDKLPNESWSEYVSRSSDKAIDSIHLLDAESSVRSDLQDSVYYNLVYCNESDFSQLAV